MSDYSAQVDVVLGDARLQLEQESPQEYDVLVLDAFSGDGVPVHLLTSEAFDTYHKHLKPAGVMAVHVSNRHLDLRPVLLAQAERAHRQMQSVGLHMGLSDDGRRSARPRRLPETPTTANDHQTTLD